MPRKVVGDKSRTLHIGEEKSFEFFFRQYYTALCFFANSIIHNQEESKDIVQDCFIKLWDGQRIQDRTDTVKSLLYTMVRNRCIDYLRKRKVTVKAITGLSENETDVEYFDELLFAETMRQIYNQISELPSKMQQVVRLYYEEGKNYKQIAEELHSSPETVRKQRQLALKRLRQKLLSITSLFW